MCLSCQSALHQGDIYDQNTTPLLQKEKQKVLKCLMKYVLEIFPILMCSFMV